MQLGEPNNDGVKEEKSEEVAVVKETVNEIKEGAVEVQIEKGKGDQLKEVNEGEGKVEIQQAKQNKQESKPKGEPQKAEESAKMVKQQKRQSEQEVKAENNQKPQQQLPAKEDGDQILKIQSIKQQEEPEKKANQLTVEKIQVPDTTQAIIFQKQIVNETEEKPEQVLQTDLPIKQKGDENEKSIKISISFVKDQENEKGDGEQVIREVEQVNQPAKEQRVEDKEEEKPKQEEIKEEQPVKDQSKPQNEVQEKKEESEEKIEQKEPQKQEQKGQPEQQEPEQQEEEQKQVQEKPKISPIVMTEENQPYNTITPKNDTEKDKQKIVQFVQYKPVQQKSTVVPVQYQGIQNEALLKRIQELEDTVKELKHKKQAQSGSMISNQQEGQEKTAAQTVEKEKEKHETGEKKKKQKEQVIHDASVHGLVAELAKTESMTNGNAVKKPVLQEKRYKRRKIDLTALMDKNMGHASNIFNLTIGEILNPNSKHEQQKEHLRKQIKQLREKVLKLEEDKRASSTIKPAPDTRRQTASTGKKQITGKLIKVSELRSSRISGFDDNDSLFRPNLNLNQSQKVETKSQRDSLTEGIALRNKVSSNSVTQREEKEAEKDKDNQNNFSFRVRRPTAKSNGQNQGQKTSLSFINNEEEKVSVLPVSQQKEESKIKKQWWEEPFIKSLQIPDMPSPPSQFDSQEDLYTLGKLTFMAFGINPDLSPQMNVRKYKNCVYFNLGEKNNILWYFDGRFYFGEWQVHLTGEGQKSGQGFEHVPGKFIYQGQFKEGKRNGFGKIKILNKEKQVMYEGNWLDGSKHGEGKQVDQYGIKYWGEWKQNKREGFGKLKLDDGDYYEGNFQKGIKNGQGTEYFKNGDKYEGNYLGNKFHGKGKYTWKNGSVYEGDFNHGIRSGQGKWKSSQTLAEIDEYEGQYDNDKKNGYGKYRWADGSEYEGFFKDDLKEGEGTIRYKNGKVAKLLWRNGQPMKKIFSQEQKKYRETQKSKQKLNETPKKAINRNDTLSSRQLSIDRDD